MYDCKFKRNWGFISKKIAFKLQGSKDVAEIEDGKELILSNIKQASLNARRYISQIQWWSFSSAN
jgi:hypothetical protein